MKEISPHCNQKEKKTSGVWQWDEKYSQLKLILASLYLSDVELMGILEPLTLCFSQSMPPSSEETEVKQIDEMSW